MQEKIAIKRQRKTDIFSRASQQSRKILQSLFTKLQDLSNTETAFQICENIAGDDFVIQLYNSFDEDSLIQQIANFQERKQNVMTQVQEIKVQTNDINIKKIIQLHSQQMIQNRLKKLNKEEPDVDQQKYSRFLKEIKETLPKFSKFLKNLNQKSFIQFFEIYEQYEQIPLFQQDQIILYCQKYRNKNDREAFINQLLITGSALYYSTQKHKLRVTQALAIYCFIYHPKTQKFLLQILTGEGKSTTIACLAAILNMRGRTVDIITTNKILAKRDAEQKGKFFSLMGMEIDHNIQSESAQQSSKPRTCYEKEKIVYGTPFSYQVDLLYDQYNKKGTRNSRPYDVVIVDEVDSLFVDQKQNQTLLASSYSGYSELKEPLKKIWHTVITHNIIKQNGKTFFLKHGQKTGDIIKGESKAVINMIISDLRKVFQNDIINHQKLEFIQMSIRKWVSSAITAAYIYKQNVHYVIEGGKITPVDFRNTGCLQKNVEWQDGLHQFLQLKHGLQISTESMTTNYMSNIGFFSRYSTLYGLTGTLGSQLSMQFLNKIYDVQMMQIPSFYQRRLKIDPGFVMFDYTDWMNKIVQRGQIMMENKRAILLICQHIEDVKNISIFLNKNIKGQKNLKRVETGQESSQDKVDVFDIIVATNVAGRGTDLKATQNLVKNGGLHVIITFMPSNLRVQMQARGRAGRNGAPGSSELIINYTQYYKSIKQPLLNKEQFVTSGFEYDVSYFQNKVRDVIERQYMNEDEARVEDLRARDKIFTIFCKATSSLPDYQQNKAKKNAIQQEFAMFLKRCKESKLSNQEQVAGAEQFSEKIIKDSQSFYKTSHGVLRGINQINNKNLIKSKELFRSVQNQNCSKNIQIAGHFLEAAVEIQLDGQNQKKQIKLDEKNRDKIKNLFQNKLKSSIKLIEQKKQIIKGVNISNLSLENTQLTQLLEARKKQQQKNLYGGKINNQEKVKEKMQQNDNIQKKSQLQKLMDCSQIKILDALKCHLQNQIKKSQNLGKDQFLQVSYKSIFTLIDQVNDKQNNTREHLRELSADIPYIPFFEKKKKKNQWSRRVLGFALGALQICVGALIVASTSGAAAGFGSFMIQSGIKDCFKAFSHPQIFDDLNQYFSGKTMEYVMAGALAGTTALKQIYTKGLEGFTLIQNSSMQNVMKTAIEKIKQGISNAGVNFDEIIKNQIIHGISNQLFKKEGQKLQIKDITRIVSQPNFKKQYSEGIQCEAQLDIRGEYIKQRFQSEAQEMIKKIVQRQYPKFISQIKQLKISQYNIKVLINNQLKGVFNEQFNNQNRDKLYLQMCHFLTSKIKQENISLAEQVIKKFKIDELITDTIRNISKSKNYKQLIINALQNEIIKNIKKVAQKYEQIIKGALDFVKTQQTRIQSTPMIKSQYNRQIDLLNQKINSTKASKQKYEKFIQQANSYIKDNKMIDKLIKQGIISSGKVNKGCAYLNKIHPYMKEAIINMENFENSVSDFMEQMERVAFDSFNGIFSKGLTAVLDASSNSVLKLNRLQGMLYRELTK